MTNTNPATGIRYGVISGNSLDGDLFDELFYGADARNLSEEEALSEARREYEAKANEIEQEVEDDWRERHDPREVDSLEALIEAAYERNGYQDRDDYINTNLERAMEYIQIEEPVIEGTYEGVKYKIDWLGGAPLVWILEGPVGYAAQLCSPCVPNAADLDSGFWLDEGRFLDPRRNEGRHMCYVCPPDWLAEGDHS